MSGHGTSGVFLAFASSTGATVPLTINGPKTSSEQAAARTLQVRSGFGWRNFGGISSRALLHAWQKIPPHIRQWCRGRNSLRERYVV